MLEPCPNPQCVETFDSQEDLLAHLSLPDSICAPFFLSFGCPNPHCIERFRCADDVTAHLGHRFSTCVNTSFAYSSAETLAYTDGSEEQHPDPGPSLPTSSRWAQYHPSSGWLYGKAPNILQEIDQDEFAHRRKYNPYYPFSDDAEWKLAKFINETMTLSQANQFLKLDWVRQNNFPVNNGLKLREWLEILPGGPQWKMSVIDTEATYPSTKPIHLYWRDGLEAAKWIFANPVFANHMQYDPVKMFTSQAREEREFSEYMSGKYAWSVQDKLPPGATQIGIIGGSDKTPVTVGTGGIEMHPVFITIANIASEVRMKATSHAWLCIGFIPVTSFKVHSDFQGVLKARLWHHCLEIMTRSLRHVARHGDWAPDPVCDVHYIFTPLVSWIADHPEQQLISCVAKNASPVSIATTKEFGDSDRKPSRHGKDTLRTLCRISRETEPWDLRQFLSDCKALQLSGVHQPFWAGWDHSDPAIFLAPELLHNCHKFFFDHVLLWCKEIVGAKELDARFKCLHRRVGIRHFSKGVSHVQQMTGREHREIQRSIVAVIYGAAPPGVVRVVRAMVDFIYQAQAPTFTTSSIQAMQASLDEFHRCKDEILKAGGRRGKNGPKVDFNVPKLELMQHFAKAAKDLGNLIQNTADVTERLLITQCKDRFIATNHRPGFEAQIVRDLQRREKCRVFDLFTTLRSSGLSMINTAVASEQAVVSSMHPESLWISRVLPGEERRLGGPRPMTNLFEAGVLAEGAMRAYHVKKTPDILSMSLIDAAHHFQLHHLYAILAMRYGTTELNLRIWHSFKIQHFAVHQKNLVMPAQTIQVFPPLNGAPANCDTVMFDFDMEGGGMVNRVAQVRVVFEIISFPGTFVYLEPYSFTGRYRTPTGAVAKEPDVDMYLLGREYTDAHVRSGLVTPLDKISHAVDLVPIFGAHIQPELTMDNSLDLPTSFLLNDHGYKELYHMFSTLFV